MSVPLDVVEQFGETADTVRLPEELGGGYSVWAEVNHQLHCLDIMHKLIY